jgi:cell division protein FtsI/penicillin-binding protein 2
MKHNARGPRDSKPKNQTARRRARYQNGKSGNGMGNGAQGLTALRAATIASTKKRIEGTFYALLIVLCFFAGRMLQLQAMNRTGAFDGKDEMFVKRQILAAPRGQILAADGTALAVTANEYDIAVNPRAVSDKDKMAGLFAKTLGGQSGEYFPLLQKTTRADGSKNYYVRVARRVDEERVDKLRALMGPPKNGKENRDQRAARKAFWEAVTLEPTPRRQYPLGNFAAQLIGFTTAAGKGVDGLERAWNKELSGRPGEIVSQVDAQGRPIPGFVREEVEPVSGRTLVTTLDPEIQAAAQETMEELVKKYKPNFATAIVMRPQTGEVVAMVTAPSFDLNTRPQNVVELATNRCTQFAYEPGSTFKIITAAAAIESVPNWQSHSFYCNGVQRVGKHSMHCWVNSTSKRRHGDEDLSESIRDSCNFGVYGFARLMGAPTLLEYSRRFGLGDRIDLAKLPEHPGLLPRNSPREWSPEQLANFSFGQGMLMTPLQLVRVAATIANEGVMMQPQLIKEIRDEQGNTLQTFAPKVEGRVIKAETAKTVLQMMQRVVMEGTARQYIFVPGYASAGKTGSAQKADGPRGYAAGKFISSFVGAIPAQKPEFVILVMADEPRGSHWGSEVCGPAYTAIAEKAMLRLRLQKGALAPAPDANLMERKKDL